MNKTVFFYTVIEVFKRFILSRKVNDLYNNLNVNMMHYFLFKILLSVAFTKLNEYKLINRTKNVIIFFIFSD